MWLNNTSIMKGMDDTLKQFLDILETEVERYRVPVIDLIGVQSSDPYRVLIATILSARTKDEVTAAAAARLFVEAPTVNELRTLSEERIGTLIYPVGFYRSKARHLRGAADMLVERLHGLVPDTLDGLLALPGVGRKTANLVLAVAFNTPAICVDTHVHRISNIWGVVNTKTVLETEMALRELLPQSYWQKVNRTLVAFGQAICRPVAPHCDVCPLTDRCAKIGVTPRRLPPLSAPPQ